MCIRDRAYLFTRRFYKVPWLFHEIGKAGNENKYTIEERYNIVRNVCKKVNRYAHEEICLLYTSRCV